MEREEQTLIRQLESLAAKFSHLSEHISQAADRLRRPEVASSEELKARLNDSWTNLDSPFASVLSLAKALTESILRVIGKLEETRLAAEQARQNAFRVLDRILAIAHRYQADFPPLLECQARARELRRTIHDSPWSDLYPITKPMAEGPYRFPALLALVEHWQDLDDERWKSLHEIVSQSFGRPLAVAASRGDLFLPMEKP